MNAFIHKILFWALLLSAGGLSAQTTVQIKLEESVNTEGLDFSPTFYEDGIIFISTNTAGLDKITDENLKLPAMSILRSRRDAEGKLGVPEPFAKEISTQFHEGPVCFDQTATTCYFSRNIIVNGKEVLAQDGVQKMKLYTSTKTGENWSEPQPLPFNTDEFDDCHPSISIDGDKMYFASNRPGGQGGMDLYVAYKVGETWSEPVNLGPEINTKGNDVFPFIHADNTLYFSSDGRGGKGGFDLYQAKFDGAKWSAPKAFPAPFNTGEDDFALIVDLNKINGYFSSNGQKGKGADEILSFHTENGNLDDFIRQNGASDDENYDLMVNVKDKSNGSAISGADVRILSTDMGDVIGRDEAGNLITVQTVDGQDILRSVPPHAGLSGSTDRKGRYATTLQPGNYSITVSQSGYQTKQVQLKTVEGANKIDIELDKVTDKVLWNASMFNYLTNTPLAGATAVVINKETGKRDTIMTDENGQIEYYLDPNSRYLVEMYQGGRLVGTTEVESGPAGSGPLTQNISVAPLLPGTSVALPNIYYNFNDATLRPDARKDLDLVVALMKQHAGMTVELASHTDSRGSDNYNQELSQRRANGVVEYLVTKGVSRNRLLPIGYGETKLRNQCADGVNCSDNDHARNRRTEIKMMTGLEASSIVYVDGKIGGGSPDKDPEPVATTSNGTAAEGTPPATHGAGAVKVSSGELEYFVIAGSFLMENRAQNQLQTLIGAGYSETQIIQFEGSPFFSVCAGRFGNRQQAEELERRIEKRDKIDAYVRALGNRQK